MGAHLHLDRARDPASDCRSGVQEIDIDAVSCTGGYRTTASTACSTATTQIRSVLTNLFYVMITCKCIKFRVDGVAMQNPLKAYRDSAMAVGNSMILLAE